MSAKKRIITNGIAALFQKGIKVAEQLLLIPFFIKYWGPAYYGEWITLTIIPTSLALADMGFGTATANTFLLKYASGDKQGAANISTTGLRILSVIVISAILLSTLIIIILKRLNIFSTSIIPSNEAISALIIMLIARILNFYPIIFEAYYRAARKASMSINFQSFIATANIVVGLVILLTGGRVVEYAIGCLIVVIILNPIYIYKARCILGLHKTHLGQIEKMAIRPLLNKGFGYFLSPIWQAIYFQGMTFIVRIILGPVAVTTFTTIRTLVRSSAQGFGMTITAVYPDFQFETGVGNLEKAKKIFIGVLMINIIMASIFIIGLVLFGQPVYSWWTNGALDISNDVWLFFILGIQFYALWFTFSFIFEATNKPFTNTASGFICSIIAVLLSWVLCKEIGLLGASIASLVFDILMCLYIVYKGKKEIGLTIAEVVELFKIYSKSATSQISISKGIKFKE